MVECDFPRGFFVWEVEILIRDPHVYSKRAENRAFWIPVFFFFVRNPYICKFWDLIFEENVNKKKESKRLSFGHAWHTPADQVSKFESLGFGKFPT